MKPKDKEEVVEINEEGVMEAIEEIESGGGKRFKRIDEMMDYLDDRNKE